MSGRVHSPDPLALRGTAVVTGGAQGIGLEIATAVAEAGALVVIADRDGAAAAAAARGLVEQGLLADSFEADVTDADAVGTLMAYADGLGEGLRYLVNNAAISTTQVIEDTEPEAWRKVIDINLTGPFLCSRAATPHLRMRGGGSIVNVASVAAKRISFNAGASYTASKAGLLAFTRHLAYEVARDGIRANAICPGPVLSPMLERTATPETIAQRAKTVPAGRISRPADQARAVVYLLSDYSDMITGAATDVDGGALLGWYDTDTYFARRRPETA